MLSGVAELVRLYLGQIDGYLARATLDRTCSTAASFVTPSIAFAGRLSELYAYKQCKKRVLYYKKKPFQKQSEGMIEVHPPVTFSYKVP